MFIYTGRFQPFHNGHLSLIKELRNNYANETICIALIRDVPFRYPKNEFDYKADVMLSKEHNPFDAITTLRFITEIISDNELDNVVTTLMPRVSNETWDIIKALLGEDRVWVFTENQLTEDVWEKQKSEFYASKGDKVLKIPIKKSINGRDIRSFIKNKEFWKLEEVLPPNVLRYLKNGSNYK